MLNELLTALDSKQQDVHKFNPEIKVRRTSDIIYISEVKKTKMNYVAMVEVQAHNGASDKAPLPLGTLDDISLKAILLRLKN